MKKYIINTRKVTAWVEVNSENVIINSAPDFLRFKNQPLQTLTNRLLAIYGEYNLKEFKE